MDGATQTYAKALDIHIVLCITTETSILCLTTNKKNVTFMEYEKKYKDALERASKLRVQNPFDTVGQMVEHIFPELAELEDERIRKALINFLKSPFVHENITDEKVAPWITWLEKQSEQKLSDKVEPKFHPEDWIIDNEYGEALKVTKVDANSYEITNQDGEAFEILKEDVECNHRLWSIADAKDGDLIYVSTKEKGIQAIFHEYKNDTIFFHCYLCADFVQGGCIPISSVELTYPLQKTHYNRFFEKMHEAGYEWDAETKESKQIKDNTLEMRGNQVVSEIVKNQKEIPGEFTKLVHGNFWDLIKTEHKMLDADKVIEWLNDQACQGWIEDVEVGKFIAKFKKDFGL